MANQITTYQCPACFAPLAYDGKTGKLECEYCGSSYTTEEIGQLYADKEKAAAAAKPENEEDAEYTASNEHWNAAKEGLKSYNCPACGAELILDATTAATSCPYCGNPTIVPGQLSNMLKPDLIIPFKLDKQAALEALKKYYKGKFLLPREFSNENHIEEIKGVYVPFWLFDGVAEADICYRATRMHSFRRGDERITTTEHYAVRRAGSLAFENIPVDASSKMPDAHMDAIEPFDYSELREFSTAYLPGFMADKYDVSAKDCAGRADLRALNTAEQKLSETVAGYATCVTTGKNMYVRRGSVKYALMPVWMLSTKWKGQNFLFAMNGQTGRLIGDLPVSGKRLLTLFLSVAAPLAALLAAFLW